MSDLTFGLRIAAKDDTQGSLRSALSGFTSFARTVAKPIEIPLRIAAGGLAVLRDINQGLRPLLAGLDNVIEKGTALEAVRKSFASLTGRSAQDADYLAKRLAAAAGGLLDDSRAMQLANRAIAGGIDAARDLPLIFEFAAKKAVSMGVDAGSMLDQIFAGFMRGSTRAFEPLGILQKGAEGVKRDFDAIKGQGAFDALGPAAQQAEMMRQAAAEMRAQLGRLGISGRETIFIWSGIKNQIGDAVDQLFGAVGRSKDLQTVLGGVRDVVAGTASHLEKGGSLKDVLFGGKDLKSGGLWGGLKAGFFDVSEMLGRGILSGVSKGMKEIPDLAKSIWAELKGVWQQLMPELTKEWEKLKKKIQEGTAPLVSALKSLQAWIDKTFGALIGWAKQKLGLDKPGGAATSKPATSQPATSQPAEPGFLRTATEGALRTVPREALKGTMAYAAGQAGKGMFKSLSENPAYADAAAEVMAEEGTLLGGRATMVKAAGFAMKRVAPILAAADTVWSIIRYGQLISECNAARKDLDDALDFEIRTMRLADKLTRERAAKEAASGRMPHGLPYPLGGLVAPTLLGVVGSVFKGGRLAGHQSGTSPASGRLGIAGSVFKGGRSTRWLEDYGEDFPADAATAAPREQLSFLDPSVYPSMPRMQRQRDREVYGINRAIRLERASMEHGDKYEIARRRRAAIRELRAGGADVRREDWGGIDAEIAEQLRAEHQASIRRLEDRRSGLWDELERSRTARGGLRAESDFRQADARTNRADAQMGQLLNLVGPSVASLLASIPSVLAELVSVNRRLAVAGPRRS